MLLDLGSQKLPVNMLVKSTPGYMQPRMEATELLHRSYTSSTTPSMSLFHPKEEVIEQSYPFGLNLHNNPDVVNYHRPKLSSRKQQQPECQSRNHSHYNSEPKYNSPLTAPVIFQPHNLRMVRILQNEKDSEISVNQDQMTARSRQRSQGILQESPSISLYGVTTGAPQYDEPRSPAALPSVVHQCRASDRVKSKVGRRPKRPTKVSLPPLYIFIRNLLHNRFYNPQVVNFVNM